MKGKNMTTKTKELNLLDVKDIEDALSDYYEREIKISEVGCTLYYCITVEGDNYGSYLKFFVGDDWCDSWDLWGDEDSDVLINGVIPSFENDCLQPEDVFNFDVSAFKSFDTEIDMSD